METEIFQSTDQIRIGKERVKKKKKVRVLIDDEQHCAVQRPNLSEAREVLDLKRKEEKPLMNWRVPSLDSTEVAMKDNLRCWAHSVASAVVIK